MRCSMGGLDCGPLQQTRKRPHHRTTGADGTDRDLRAFNQHGVVSYADDVRFDQLMSSAAGRCAASMPATSYPVSASGCTCWNKCSIQTRSASWSSGTSNLSGVACQWAQVWSPLPVGWLAAAGMVTSWPPITILLSYGFVCPRRIARCCAMTWWPRTSGDDESWRQRVMIRLG